MSIPIQVLINLETQEVKISNSFYRGIVYSNIRNKLIDFSLLMMEDNKFSLRHI